MGDRGGPFLNPNPGYRGAHPEDTIVPADTALMERLLTAGRGFVRLVTLAPESDRSLSVTRMLAKREIVVSAGHTNASLDQLRAAIDNGSESSVLERTGVEHGQAPSVPQ